MAPHLPWAGTLTEKGLPPSAKLEPSFCFSYASARAACQVAADVATRDRWPHAERNVEPAAAVHMVALGCAHDQGMGRSCACGGRMQGLDHGDALNYGWKFPLNRGWNHKGMGRGNKGGVDFFSSAAQTAAWGRLVGRHRDQKRS
jgi:hypothetical protein